MEKEKQQKYRIQLSPRCILAAFRVQMKICSRYKSTVLLNQSKASKAYTSLCG